MKNSKLLKSYSLFATLLITLFLPITLAEEMSVEDKIKCAMSAAPMRISTDPKDNSIFVIYKGTPMEIVIIPTGDVIVE